MMQISDPIMLISKLKIVDSTAAYHEELKNWI